MEGRRERILVVDDEEHIVELVELYLGKEGYEVTCALEGDTAVEKFTEEKPDLVVLSTGFVPSEGNADLAKLLGVTLDKDGFFKEADAKMRPVETEQDGIYICGLAHSPQSVEESLSQASAAAGKAGLFLLKGSR